MAASLRFYLTGFVLAASLAGVASARPGWLEVLGVQGVQHGPQANHQLVTPPDAVCEIIHHRMRRSARPSSVCWRES